MSNEDRKISQIPQVTSLTGSELFLFGGASNGAVSAATLKSYTTEGLEPKTAFFIDLWNDACNGIIDGKPYGSYDPAGNPDKPFVLDQQRYTYAEALNIYNVSVRGTQNGLTIGWPYATVSAVLPVTFKGYGSVALTNIFEYSYVRYAVFVSNYGASGRLNGPVSLSWVFNVWNWFIRDSNLNQTWFDASSTTGAITMGGDFQLERLRIRNIKCDVKVKDSPNLSRECLEYWIQYAANTTAITFTVHANVYAKLTGDTTNAAVTALTESERTAWQQLVASAAAKQITFVTP